MWRILLGRESRAAEVTSLLSSHERNRALRLRHEADRTAFTVAHAAMRTILAAYTKTTAAELDFVEGSFGKPSLVASMNVDRLEFNLAHSGDVGLLAIARERAVGIDVTKWDASVDHSTVAERSFSPRERDTLASLATPELLLESFYAAWSRKEAYLKATGLGLSRGLEHFDVACAPGEPAALLADRLDPDATSRWSMVSLSASDGYSAALVVENPVGNIVLFDAPAL